MKMGDQVPLSFRNLCSKATFLKEMVASLLRFLAAERACCASENEQKDQHVHLRGTDG